MSPIDLSSLPRVFGRPRAFDVECPNCGELYLVRMIGKGRKRGRSRTAKGAAWDALSSTLTCRQCFSVWIVGLALWKPIKGPRRPALPRDQVPNRLQLAQLRQLTGALLPGQVTTDNRTRPITTNLVPECLCDRLAPPLGHVRRYRVECPIHES